MSQTDIPAELRYTAEHEWVQRTGPTTVRIGITDYAQSQLGDVVFVQLPAEDDAVTSGESFGEVESTKSVSDIYAPLSGTVAAVNGDLDGDPELVNSDPYGAGWLVDLTAASESDLDDALEGMLDAEAYASITAA
ncbi:glycine cleavage system protein GcvH [Rhodococcus kroppenstedtii]|uniref:Glycine cleavage system H protein n=1 Tax=Rhodococcoides kroppenstedtii TaxID=293050 RepID=A0A1I0UB90_9NOCA|nr:MULTISPECIES: glycine cleavage system protein GcvH [Rhodococcus]AMY19203.1 Glycine cleavage system H protein [Rhodococcus sp. PBTS 1]MBY6311645.1 glycine cleavage system protein GcvH [Rhodococcus kroppenstedtii]MBY6319229.1 glycine cleavage system protein GcvH [Rhodococcus kroppenstedtii]MBY6397912.1 glycine cleavage system protein GcvH [Rhodococcus kroppenstedtii]MDV7199230.1 glycine cleavage system protein GcvH [Rhodococcus kroppenstedtii]